MVSVAERVCSGLGALVEVLRADRTFDAVSIWGVAIRNGLGLQDFFVDPQMLRQNLLETDSSESSIADAHAARADFLPAAHKDPFDRILVAQAQVRGIRLLTADPMVAR